ncbi:MAG TPA: hypothetical protein VEA99_03890 [Gemmatimonadaceae bacterium]|nr:hypothetical protein [Gemmatimonadaceae bacterium]
MTPTTQQRGDVAVPTDRAQLEALVSRRNELQGQLRNAEERRAALAVQSNITPPEQRGALTQRIAGLDQRIGRLEADVARLDEAIAAGTADPATAARIDEHVVVVPPTPPTPPMLHGADGITIVPPMDGPPVIHPRMVVGGAMLTLSMMAMVAWVTWRRAKARFGRFGAAVTPAPDVVRLQQSVDTIALEVERISESQRFLTKVLAERAAEQVGSGRER